MVDYAVVFTIGLLGSAHCVGMCGGFVLALAQTHNRARSLQTHQAVYYLGKTLTYAVFGALVGGVGASLAGWMGSLQNGLSIVLGIILVGVGLSLIGVLRKLPGATWLSKHMPLASWMGRMIRKKHLGGTFGLGMLNGLLPCGLVYGLLIKAAATESVMGGATTMAVFGLATIPALYAVSLSSFLMRPLWRSRFNLASGILVIALGVLTVVRGTDALSYLMRHGTGHQHMEHTVMPADSTIAPLERPHEPTNPASSSHH